MTTTEKKPKRLYVVRYDVEFPALATSEKEAISFVEAAVRDDYDKKDGCSANVMYFTPWSSSVSPQVPLYPQGWEDCQDACVYGTDEQGRLLTLAEAVEREREVRANAAGISRKFLELSTVDRIAVVHKLGVLTSEEMVNMPEDDMYKTAFKRAKERGLISELATAVDEQHQKAQAKSPL